jgi:hypothetical protein
MDFPCLQIHGSDTDPPQNQSSRVKHHNVHNPRQEKNRTSQRITELSSIAAVGWDGKMYWQHCGNACRPGECATLDEKQRTWIFQPSDRSWSSAVGAAEGMEDVWIDFTPLKTSNL